MILITSYFADSDHFMVYKLIIVTCYRSDMVVGRTLCERMLHQSQSSIFMGLFCWQFDRKITVTSNQKMLNTDPDNLPGPIIGLAQVKFRNQQIFKLQRFFRLC